VAGALPVSAHDFERLLRSHAEVGDRQLEVRVDTSFGTRATVYVTFVNAPSARPGSAEWHNNRMLLSVEGWGKDPSLGADKLTAETLSPGPFERIRKKSGSPLQIAKYLGDWITRTARTVPPRLH
jgi:hypothetical protein